MSAATVVLVHGAWYAPSCWDAVVDELEIPSLRVDLPSCQSANAGLEQDSAAVANAVSEAPGPVLLVGHSYGGMAISQAGGGAAHLLYVCAFLLDVGQSRRKSAGGPPPWWRPSPDGTVLTVRDPAAVLFNDCPPEVATRGIAGLRPFAAHAVADPLGTAAWRTVPASYVVCTRDAALLPEAQHSMATNAGTVHTLDAGHSPFLSRPTELAAIINATAYAVPTDPTPTASARVH